MLAISIGILAHIIFGITRYTMYKEKSSETLFQNKL